MEQVYKEIDLHDAVLVAQLRTRINQAKESPSKKVRFTEDSDQNEQNILMIYSSIGFNSQTTRDRVTPSFIQVHINQA
jgi:hypothetical protein